MWFRRRSVAGDALDAVATADVATNQRTIDLGRTLVVLGTKAKHELWWVLSRTRCVKIGSASVPSAAGAHPPAVTPE